MPPLFLPTTELVLAGNGPGELAGWVRPVARAARTLGGTDLGLTLVLSPSQFAGGREREVVRSWAIADRVVDPREGVRIALGLSRLPTPPQAAVVHLGGDLWFSTRLARRLGIPACAVVETVAVARRHQAFSLIFATAPELADQLAARGVPEAKLIVTGDPRGDLALRARRPLASGSRPNSQPGAVVSLLPGSRDRFVSSVLPSFLVLAAAVAERRPSVRFQVIVSEFVSPALSAALQRDAARRWPQLAVDWISADPWDALANSDLVLTVPGSNTVELAMAGLPFAVIIALDWLREAPAEGLVEWAGRLPLVGRPLKGRVLEGALRRQRYAALPNRAAGREVAPEWIGRWSSRELANRVVTLLDDAVTRTHIGSQLQQLYPGSGQASRRVAERALALARRTS